MKKVLILGAGGMAGHVVSLYLREHGFEVDTLSARNKLDDNTFVIDVTNQNEFKEFLDNHQYDAVINCIGILVKQSDERKDLAAYLNAYLPHYLEARFKGSQTKVVHLSTDCVFSGENPPYKENSLYDGQLFYDRSKALGEIVNDKDLTFRMSIIGPDMQPSGIGLFNWFYQQTGEITGYTKSIWDGITTIELARGITAALEQDLTGLYHLVPAQHIAKFDLLGLFKETFGRDDITIKPADGVSADKTLVNTRTDFDFTVSPYEQMVAEMRDWIDAHKDLYKHYER
jgi:dTDP-4-dehydrorhamnose reductase